MPIYTHTHKDKKRRPRGTKKKKKVKAETRKGVSKNEKGTRKSHNETLYV